MLKLVALSITVCAIPLKNKSCILLKQKSAKSHRNLIIIENLNPPSLKIHPLYNLLQDLFPSFDVDCKHRFTYVFFFLMVLQH